MTSGISVVMAEWATEVLCALAIFRAGRQCDRDKFPWAG